MRHARQSGLGVTDHERPLTDEGRDAAHRVGCRLRDENRLPARGLCSTALRCRQTWQTLLDGAGATIEADFEAELYNASPAELLGVLAGTDETIESVLLLAHNPGMTMLALHLAGSNQADLDTLRAGFSPGTTAVFEVRSAWSEVAPGSVKLLAFAPV